MGTTVKLPFGIQIELIEGASQFWRLYSSWIFMFISAMGVVQAFIPFVSWMLPGWVLGVLWFLIGLAGLLARVIKQFNLAEYVEPTAIPNPNPKEAK